MKPNYVSSAQRWARQCLTLACVMLVLNGCGGGGGATTATPNPVTPPAPAPSPLTLALSSGNASAVDAPAIKLAADALIDTQIAAYATLKQSLFQNVGAIDWEPGHDSVWLNVNDNARNHVLLPGNWRYSDSSAGTQRPLGVFGNAPGGFARYAVFGANPLAIPGNAALNQFMLNTVKWLSASAGSASFKVVTAHLPGVETYWFPHEKKTRDWFYTNFPGVSVNGLAAGATQADDLCDGNALAACLDGASLLVIGRGDSNKPAVAASVVQAVRDAQARGIPVLYLHHYRDLNDISTGLMQHFGLGVSSNYFSQEGLKTFDPATLPAKPDYLVSIKNLLSHLDLGNFSTTWSGCTTSGRISCAGDASYMAEFGTPAAALRSALRELDGNGVALFAQPGYQLEKLLVLWGDKLRTAVSYPINKADTSTFLRAYFSDMTVYINRDVSALAKNLGNFAPNIPASTPTISQTVSTAAPESGRKEYLTGLYVMPGTTVKLTRTDAGAAKVSFGLNMLRDTTWVFNTYDRPTQIASPHVPLLQNHSVTISSPFGGPLLLFIDAASGVNPAVSVTVDGVITHPVLRDANNASDVANFQAAVNTTPTNWVGFATDALTLQSTLPQFKSSMALYNNNMAALASDTWLYTIKDTYELAGFNAANGQLQLAATVLAVCDAKLWDCSGLQHRRDSTQHVIADVHALCGDGCSGNPYDQDWAFNPLGWGETHEIGHGIQPARLKVYADRSGEVSNNVFPMHKQMKFNASAAGQATPIVSRPGAGKQTFDTLKSALASADPVTATYDSIWSDASYAANNTARVMFYRQLAEHAHYYNGAYTDAWEIYTLMYLLDRNMSKNAANWASVAAGYGFGTYAAYPATLSGNDFLLMSSSNLIGRDMGPMFDLWGIRVSAAAKAQVSAYGLPATAKLYFPMTSLTVPGNKVGAPITMTASASYPAGF
ncbi:MAG: ImpA family metalloprotease [Pseudomonadota bacterium]